MKKLSASLLLVFFTTLIYAGTLNFSYNISSPAAKDVGIYNVIMFDGLYLTGKTGEPALPYQAVKLMLPPGEEAMSVIWKFENLEIIDGSFLLYPQQPSQPYSVGSDGIFHQDLAVYSSTEVYPAQAWGEYSTHFLNGHSILLASFTPVRYVPATGQVSFYRQVTVTVETRATNRAGDALNNINTNVNINKRIKVLVQNVSMMASYPEKSNREGEYQVLIITPNQFAGSFQPLIDLYLLRGYKSNVVTTESINITVPGQDMQQKIRNYIISQYQDNGVESVVLGGDAEHIPYRGFYCQVQSSSLYEDSNIPSDLYYSGLDGNWNTDGDNLWAEIGEDDLLPDVAVARLPFSNANQLQRILHKTTLYQDDPVEGELRNVLMAGEHLWSGPDTYGEDYLELLIGYRDDNGYITDGMYEDLEFTKMYDSESPWEGYDLINQINQGSTFIHHSGHASQTYVMRLGITDINNGNFNQVDGVTHNYPIIYTHGCLCGAFDENDCIGEAMVLIDNFAVAGAFNSRYGWFNEGQTEGPSAHLHREFVDALYHDKENRVGAAHMISRIATAPWVNAPGQWEEGALRWCFYCCNILGDPMLGAWIDEPYDIVTEYPATIEPGETSITVTVTNNGEPMENYNCVIFSEGTMLGCCPTDENGQAVIQVPGGFADATTADLYVSGYNCLPHQYTLNISVGVDELAGNISQLSISPNPFDEKANLSFTIEKAQPVRIIFYLVSGQKLTEMSFEAQSGKNDVSVSTSTWPEGIIQARIVSGSGIINQRLVHISK